MIAISNPRLQMIFVSQLSTTHCVCENKSTPGKGRRGRPTKAESLARERRDGSTSGSIFSILAKRNKSSGSESEQEDKDKKKQRVKNDEEKADIKEERKEQIEGTMDKMEEMLRKLLAETKQEILDKVEQKGEEIKREIKKKMKDEIEKIRAEERKAREKLENELKELKEKVQEMEKKNIDQERRERRLNIVIKGVEIKGGNVREAVTGVFEKMGVNENEINVKDAYMIRVKEKESMIVVKLSSMYDKRKVMENKNKLRGSRVYVDDDMMKSERDRQSAIRGWAKNERAKGLKKKDEEFWKFLNDFDVIGLIETWVDEREWEKIKDKMPEGWRWKCQIATREGKRGRAKGGIVTGVRRELEERETGYDEREGIQEREVVIDGERWRFVIVYNREGQKEGLEALKEVIKEEEEGILMVAGDFNARIGVKEGWSRQNTEGDGISEEVSRESRDKVVNKQGKDLMEVIEERGWMVLNGVKEGDEKGEWTYEKGGGRSVIDFGIVNWEAWERVGGFEVGCRGESDHQPIMIELGTYYEREEERRGEEIRLQDWSEEGIRKYRMAIEKVKWIGGGVRERWEELEREINKAVEEGRYEEFVRCKKEYRKPCEKKEVEYKRREEKEIENIKTESEAWKFINRGRRKRERVCKEISMKEWITYFMGSLGGVEEREGKGSRILGVERANNGGIGIEMVKNEIRRLKRGKAGLDGIKNETWKEGGEIIGKRLEILKGVWEREGFPESWRVEVVVPIWKGGERREPGNYRAKNHKVFHDIVLTDRVKVRELLLPHPAYSPDLAPCDYFLFPNLNKWFGGKRFTTREQLIAETEAYFERLDKLYYSDGLKKLDQMYRAERRLC
ncbi:MOS1T transposase, partial [Pseudoatta argentina]